MAMRFLRRPLVSVAMTSFNHGPYVAEAIESVLNQTVRDLELIVVDDGSTDSSVDVISRIRDARITFIRLERNREAHARNTALARCRGRYVAFQNSDDRWTPQKLERQIEQLERDATLSVCFTAAIIINAQGEPDPNTRMKDLFKNVGRSRSTWLRRFFDQGNCLCFPSALIRSRNLKRTGLMRGSLIQLADFDLWIRLAALGDLLVLDEPLTAFRVLGSQNLSAPSPRQRRRSRIEMAEILQRYCEPLLLRQAHTVFPDFLTAAHADVVRQALLARYAAQQADARKRFFADRVWQRLFDSADARQTLTDQFGPEMFHEYLANRSTLTFSTED